MLYVTLISAEKILHKHNANTFQHRRDIKKKAMLIKCRECFVHLLLKLSSEHLYLFQQHSISHCE